MNEKCVQIIPSLSNALCPYKADLGTLESIITTDVENHRKPLIVFARAGNKFCFLFILHYPNAYFFYFRCACYWSDGRYC